tara:strand:+ start:340 stop:1005 length:666 start_codon:yes stop_codon:yes gene_type:complete
MWNTLFHVAQAGDGLCLRDVISALQHLLPCSHCRASLQLYCRKNPPSICVTDPLLYVWTLKDSVNQKLRRHCIPYDIFQARLQTGDFAGAVNSVHTLCYISRNIERMGGADKTIAAPHLRTLFDSLTGFFQQRGHLAWCEVDMATRGEHVQDAVFKAHRMLVGGEMTCEQRQRAYDAAFPTPGTKEPRATQKARRAAPRSRSRRGVESTPSIARARRGGRT